MQVVDLFSGIGGFALATSWMLNWKIVQFVEIDKYCQKRLKKHWPDVPIHSDIKTFGIETLKKSKWNPEETTIVVGGFPCQPFSVAGKQKGEEDDRNLWPEMLRVVREIQPAVAVGENVPGIIRMELENICASLESENYKVQPIIIPSASIGAWDKRDRVWIIAHNDKWCGQKYGLQTRGEMPNGEIKIDSNNNRINSNNAGYNSGTISQQKTPEIQINSNINGKGMEGHAWHEFTKRQKEAFRRNGKANWSRNWIEVASKLCRSNARVPNRMDRIKALGNSVNPYVVFEIFKAIDYDTKNQEHQKHCI